MELDDRAYSVTWTSPYSPRLLVDSRMAYQEVGFELIQRTGEVFKSHAHPFLNCGALFGNLIEDAVDEGR